MALKLGIQIYQILTNDDEVCIPSLSSILLAVHFNFLFQEKWHITQEISHDFRIFDALHCHHSLLFGNFSQSQTKQKKRTVAHEKQVSIVFEIMEFKFMNNSMERSSEYLVKCDNYLPKCWVDLISNSQSYMIDFIA